MNSRSFRARAIAGLVIAASAVTLGVVAAAPAQAACTDIDVVFARGTGEPAGLGTVGRPFAAAVASALPGLTVSSYAVNYAANSSQTSAGPGATDMSNHIASVAAACPNTRFVIGGYSQGATVTSIAVGIRTGSSTGTPIPAALAARVAAVVVYGNPLGISGRTIATASPTYGPKSVDYCASGDPVCGGGGNFAAHLAYPRNGSIEQGAAFAARLVGTTPTPGPTPGPTPVPTPGPTAPPAATCVRASTEAHVDADRAVEVFGRAYARGTRDSLGIESRFNFVSLKSVGTDSWARVTGC